SPGSEGYRYYNYQEETRDRFSVSSLNHPANSSINSNSSSGIGDISSTSGGVRMTQSVSTWNAVYCSVVLDEFVKELSALSLEHSLLLVDGHLSS
ncbi:FTS and Hook-interacting protein homolog, partial [Elysia marginata]